MYYSSNQGPVITPTLIVLWQMTSIWLSLQNVSVAESSRWPSTSFRISTFGSCCKLILSLVAEHITDLRTEHNNFMLLKLFEVPCHLLFSFYSALGWEPHFHRRFSPNTSVSVLKAEEVRFTDIHFAWRVFHLKLLQIRTGSDLTCVPQSLDHCLKLLAIVLFFPSTYTLSILISSSLYPPQQWQIIWRWIKWFLCFFSLSLLLRNWAEVWRSRRAGGWGRKPSFKGLDSVPG